MRKQILAAAALLLLAAPSYGAGIIQATARSWRVATAPVGGTDCERSVDGDREVIVCDPGERATLEFLVPEDSGGDWTMAFQWEVSANGTDVACATVCNVVCLPGQDCDALTPANCTVTSLQEDASTADVLIEDTAAAAKLEEGTPADCGATNCNGYKVLWTFDRETGAGCASDTIAEPIRIQATPITHAP